MEDVDIIELFWRRDESAIRVLSKKYHGYCFRIAWNVIRNWEDSEECVNDTWFAAWTCIPPQRPSVLSAFLGKITRRFAIDVLRKKNAAKRMDAHIIELSDEIEMLSEKSGGPEEYVNEKEFIALLNCFLRKLPERDRDMFIRRYWYMDSIGEIAQRHGCSVGKVKSNLYRNRKRLKQFLEREYPECMERCGRGKEAST
ncbi:MAG: sigma-70 family RNA polymerase sigma factor [Eubacteriales bacterium]|nr:sigma-70 family RNA polymerase sigma factor [Eubacteriales bacterium]